MSHPQEHIFFQDGPSNSWFQIWIKPVISFLNCLTVYNCSLCLFFYFVGHVIRKWMWAARRTSVHLLDLLTLWHQRSFWEADMVAKQISGMSRKQTPKLDLTSLVGSDLPCEQMFLSGMASSIYKVVRVDCQSPSRGINEPATRRLTSDANDFVNAKSNAGIKPLLAE